MQVLLVSFWKQQLEIKVAYRKMIVYEWGVRLNSFMTSLSDKSVRQSIISQTGLVYHAID